MAFLSCGGAFTVILASRLSRLMAAARMLKSSNLEGDTNALPDRPAAHWLRYDIRRFQLRTELRSPMPGDQFRMRIQNAGRASRAVRCKHSILLDHLPGKVSSRGPQDLAIFRKNLWVGLQHALG